MELHVRLKLHITFISLILAERYFSDSTLQRFFASSMIVTGLRIFKGDVLFVLLLAQSGIPNLNIAAISDDNSRKTNA